MSYSRLITRAEEAFKELPQGKNLLVLHPQFRYHNALIDALLSHVDWSPLYVTLPHPSCSLSELWLAMQTELEHAYGVSLPDLEGATPSRAARTFWKAISSVLPMAIILVAYDTAEKDVHAFLSAVMPELNDQCFFVVDSRVWPAQLVDSVSNKDSIMVLPVSPSDILLDYLDRNTAKVILEVRALGSGQVLIDGRQIEQWDGALPRSLFFYFIDRGMTTRDEVFATFWPELSTREATNVFHVTKRKISEILGVDLTVYSSGFYRISPDVELHYDVVSFAEDVQNSAVMDPPEAERLLKRAVSLYERDFLSDFEQHWASRRRNELRLTYVDALTALARLCEEEGRDVEALGLYNRAFGAFPQREDLARSQMRLYKLAHQPQRALLVYDRLVQELKTTLGVEPSPETVAMADEVRAGVA
jgi:DNA-binding SARP family transcriptional activator